jgi:hypothetical protein
MELGLELGVQTGRWRGSPLAPGLGVTLGTLNFSSLQGLESKPWATQVAAEMGIQAWLGWPEKQ